MRVPRIAFDIMLLVFYLVTANPATTGMPLHEYLGVGVFVLMVAHVVMSGEGLGGRGRWTQRVLNGVLLVALAFCVVSGDHGVGGAASLLGPLCDWLLFLGSRARPFRQSTTSRLLVHIVLRIPVVMSVFAVISPILSLDSGR